jgi:acetyl esterase/lipase
MPTPLPSLGDAPDVPTSREGLATMLGQMMASGLIKPPDMTGIKQEEIQIPVRDGSSIRGILVKPESGSPGPLVLLYHGGGWCIGMAEMELAVQVMLAKSHGATSISVDYRMAPEKVFPGPIEDCIDSMNWVRNSILLFPL